MLPSISKKARQSVARSSRQSSGSRSDRQMWSEGMDQVDEEYEIQMRQRLQKINVDSLARNYQQQKLLISPLQRNDYLCLARDPQLEILVTLPTLGDDDEEQRNLRKEVPFLRFTDINYLSQNVLENKPKLKPDLFPNRYHMVPTQSNGHSRIIKTDASQHQSEDPSILSRLRDRVSQQLQHNHETLNQMRQASKSTQNENLKRITQLSKNISETILSNRQAKSYPSKRVQEQQKIEIMKRQIKMGESINPKSFINNDDDQSVSSQYYQNKLKESAGFFYHTHNVEWSPNSREAMTMVSLNNKLILYGGLGVKNTDELFEAEINKDNYKWRRVPIFGDVSKSSYYARFDHVAVVYRSTMIVLGGEQVQDRQGQKQRDILNDVRTFNLTTGESRTLRSLGLVEGRKAHAGTIIGKFMIIHGGVSARGQYLKDLNIFDVVNLKWSNTYVEPTTLFDKGIGFHDCASIYSQYTRNPELYKKVQENENNEQKIEGVLFFGGINSAGEVQNQLIQLETYKKPMSFNVIQSLIGKPPVGRYKHTVSYNELLNMFVVCGGMNSNGECIDDINILDLKTLMWQSVTIHGKPFQARCAHGAAMIETRMYIFGGYGGEGFVPADLEILELDSGTAKMLNEQSKLPARQGVQKKGIVLQSQKQKEEEINITYSKKEMEKKKERHALINSLSYRNLQSFLPMPQARQSVLFMLRSKTSANLNTTKSNQSLQADNTRIKLEIDTINEETRNHDSPLTRRNRKSMSNRK